MLALIKGVVDVGVVFVPQTYSEKLADMLIVRTWCSNNIGTHNWKKKDHELLTVSLILLYMYLITYTL